MKNVWKYLAICGAAAVVRYIVYFMLDKVVR